ncbi:hypothetical protein BIWAKO_06220 [Bosea sp. BIWAKO-01]|nr:hypothetical protein BIWAKO_06220 [Bosea sp. BIWAKO-01]
MTWSMPMRMSEPSPVTFKTPVLRGAKDHRSLSTTAEGL